MSLTPKGKLSAPFIELATSCSMSASKLTSGGYAIKDSGGTALTGCLFWGYNVESPTNMTAGQHLHVFDGSTTVGKYLLQYTASVVEFPNMFLPAPIPIAGALTVAKSASIATAQGLTIKVYYTNW
ncbi:MAG TPA: hypothetical protein DCX03_11930 [Bacteroidales bacterium]|nr:hypothetical protein [Bacteroidales bacterium]